MSKTTRRNSQSIVFIQFCPFFVFLWQLKIKTLQRRAEFQSEQQQETKASEKVPVQTRRTLDGDGGEDDVEARAQLERVKV